MPAGQTPTSVNITEKLLRRLKRLTEDNLNGEAYQEAAQALGMTDLHDRFARIERTRTRLGHLPLDLNQARHRAYEELMQAAKRCMPSALYQRFYMCF